MTYNIPYVFQCYFKPFVHSLSERANLDDDFRLKYLKF